MWGGGRGCWSYIHTYMYKGMRALFGSTMLLGVGVGSHLIWLFWPAYQMSTYRFILEVYRKCASIGPVIWALFWAIIL